MGTFSVSKCRPSGTWKMVVVTLSYVTGLSKYFVQPRLRYLSYNQCDCSPHRETIKIKESSRICKHSLMETSSSYVKHKCSFSEWEKSIFYWIFMIAENLTKLWLPGLHPLHHKISQLAVGLNNLHCRWENEGSNIFNYLPRVIQLVDGNVSPGSPKFMMS